VPRSRWKGTVRVFDRLYLEQEYFGQEQEHHSDQSLLEALAAVANLPDDPQAYEKLRLKWPYIWPVRITDEVGDERLSWAPEAFALLRLYRDLLRKIWIWPRDPDDLHERDDKRGALQILMGIAEFLPHLGRHTRDPDFVVGNSYRRQYEKLWQEIRKDVPGATLDSITTVYPSWPSGQFVYMAQNPFQRGLYLLFRESWRARICIDCRCHFIADKHQRQYCSTTCAGRAKRRHDLEWWHREHGKESKTKRKRGKQ
jgi:hypothetical protein